MSLNAGRRRRDVVVIDMLDKRVVVRQVGAHEGMRLLDDCWLARLGEGIAQSLFLVVVDVIHVVQVKTD